MSEDKDIEIAKKLTSVIQSMVASFVTTILLVLFAEELAEMTQEIQLGWAIFFSAGFWRLFIFIGAIMFTASILAKLVIQEPH